MKKLSKSFEILCFGLAVIFLLGSAWYLISDGIEAEENGIPALYEIAISASFLLAHLYRSNKRGAIIYMVLSLGISSIVLFDFGTAMVALKSGGYSNSLIISEYSKESAFAILYIVAFALNAAIHLRLGRGINKAD